MGSKAELVQAIKDLQRSDPDAKQVWGQYCDEHLGGARDPNRHDVGTLQGFLDSFHDGGAPAPPQRGYSGPAASYPQSHTGWQGQGGGGASAETVDNVKALQRSDENAKQAWWNYCDMHLGGKKDPTFHSEQQLLDFLQGYENGTLTAEVDQDLDDASQPALVQRIKYLQRSDQGAKQAWWKYCDEHLGGKKDPGIHDTEALQDFLHRYHTGTLDEGGASGGSPSDELVSQIKLLQRTDERAKEAWGKFCGGVRDPSRHPAAFLEEFLHSYHNGGNTQRNTRPQQRGPRFDNNRPPPPPQPPSFQNQKPMQVRFPPIDVVGDSRQKQCLDFIRHGTVLSPTFKQAWNVYRSVNGGQLNEPAKYQAYVSEFADYLGNLVQADLQGAEASGPVEDDMEAPPPPPEVPRKRPPPGPPVGQPPAKSSKSGAPAGATRTVAIKKKIADAIRRINASGNLAQPIRLPRVAGPLSALEESTAMGILEGMEELGDIEDPSEFIVEQALSLAK